MRPLFSQLPTVSQAASWAPAITAVGLVVLLVAAWWPTLPAVTGMALVGLGATSATVERFRGTSALVPVLVIHLAIYGGLYALFVGATLDAVARADGGVGLAVAIDLAASIRPMAAAFGLVANLLRGTRSAE